MTTGLGIAEGIESTLAAASGYSPVWSTIDAGNMETMPVLAGIETLVIFADHDKAGLHAAEACADRWAAVVGVTIVKPDVPGTDMAELMADTVACHHPKR